MAWRFNEIPATRLLAGQTIVWFLIFDRLFNIHVKFCPDVITLSVYGRPDAGHREGLGMNGSPEAICACGGDAVHASTLQFKKANLKGLIS